MILERWLYIGKNDEPTLFICKEGKLPKRIYHKDARLLDTFEAKEDKTPKRKKQQTKARGV